MSPLGLNTKCTQCVQTIHSQMRSATLKRPAQFQINDFTMYVLEIITVTILSVDVMVFFYDDKGGRLK